MKTKEMEELLQEVQDLSSDYYYICDKAPSLLKRLQAVNGVSKKLKGDYYDALKEMEHINNNLYIIKIMNRTCTSTPTEALAKNRFQKTTTGYPKGYLILILYTPK